MQVIIKTARKTRGGGEEIERRNIMGINYIPEYSYGCQGDATKQNYPHPSDHDVQK